MNPTCHCSVSNRVVTTLSRLAVFEVKGWFRVNSNRAQAKSKSAGEHTERSTNPVMLGSAQLELTQVCSFSLCWSLEFYKVKRCLL